MISNWHGEMFGEVKSGRGLRPLLLHFLCFLHVSCNPPNWVAMTT